MVKVVIVGTQVEGGQFQSGDFQVRKNVIILGPSFASKTENCYVEVE